MKGETSARGSGPAHVPAPLIATLLLTVWTAFAPQHGVGQEAATRVTIPTLYGHAFVDAPMLRSPFVRTSVMNSVGAGTASDVDYGSIVLPSGDTLYSLKGTLSVATLDFEYQHALRDWLGAWGQIRVGARTGTEAASLIATGVTFAVGFDLGWLARLRLTERSILSASLEVANQSATFVDLPRWLDEIRAGDGAQLVRTTPALRVGGGLHYAWVLNDLVAFSGSFEGARGQSIQVREDRWFLSGGVGASVNLHDRYGIPLGFGWTAKADGAPSLEGITDGSWQASGVRLAYTGRDDVRLSLTMEARRVPFDEEKHMIVNDISIDLKYYF
jgi:hypothetical protein